MPDIDDLEGADGEPDLLCMQRVHDMVQGLVDDVIAMRRLEALARNGGPVGVAQRKADGGGEGRRDHGSQVVRDAPDTEDEVGEVVG